jgi:hypothetical protein
VARKGDCGEGSSIDLTEYDIERADFAAPRSGNKLRATSYGNQCDLAPDS